MAEFVKNEQVRERQNFQQLLNDLQADKLKDGKKKNQAHRETMDTLAKRLIRRFTPQVREINDAKRRREEELGQVLLPDLKYGY